MMSLVQAQLFQFFCLFNENRPPLPGSSTIARLIVINLLFRRNTFRKKVIPIIKITKKEAFEMRKVLGEENVKKTYSKHPTYYLVETKYNLRCLEKYRKNHIVNRTK